MGKTIYVSEENQVLTLEVSLINNKEEAQENVKIKIDYPASLEYLSHFGGTYNSVSRLWTIASVPALSGKSIIFRMKVIDIDSLPADFSWDLFSTHNNIFSGEDCSSKWIVAQAPSSTAADVTIYPISGNVLGGEVICGCCDRVLEIIEDSADNFVIDFFDTETGDFGGHVLVSGQWSFQWQPSCVCEDEDDNISWGPYTVSGDTF